MVRIPSQDRADITRLPPVTQPQGRLQSLAPTLETPTTTPLTDLMRLLALSTATRQAIRLWAQTQPREPSATPSTTPRSVLTRKRLVTTTPQWALMHMPMGMDLFSAFGTGSTAVGEHNSAFGTEAYAFGAYNSASGTQSIATGIAGGPNYGYGAFNSASGTRSVAAGYFNSASGSYSYALGVANSASVISAQGRSATTTRRPALVPTLLGPPTRHRQPPSSAIGYVNTAVGTNSFASGTAATAVGAYSQATGYAATATGAGTAAHPDLTLLQSAPTPRPKRTARWPSVPTVPGKARSPLKKTNSCSAPRTRLTRLRASPQA